MAQRPNSVAVVGDGPAGTTLATLLARRGLAVGLFSRGERQSPLVGESMVPAVVPILRELGVEEEVRSYAVLKPGATFTVGADEKLLIDFDHVRGRAPGYAYNVPRDRFDATLLEASLRSGVALFQTSALLKKTAPGAGPAVCLSDETLALTDGFFGSGPDFIVDASGRSRLLARTLNLKIDAGERRDTALFAHCEGVPIDHAGHVHTDRLDVGWSWRIPLGDCVSLGIVADPSRLKQFGSRPEEQFDSLVRDDSVLSRIASEARRITPVLKFNNYQQTTRVGVGAGWALVGDSLGFVDPVFSSGLYLAMEGAQRLAAALAVGTQHALEEYDRRQRAHINAWRRLVDYFYDGRFFAMLRLRDQPQQNWIGRTIGPHIGKHLPRVFTGESSSGVYDMWLLDLVMNHSLEGVEGPPWSDWRIK